MYYVDYRPRYYFSDAPYTRKIAESEKMSDVLSCLMFIGLAMVGSVACFVTFFLVCFHSFQKVNVDYDTTVIIEDNVDVLTDQEESELKEAFEKFTDITGVTPAFHSIDLTSWRSWYDSLERYAYYQYLNMFDDEKHWLIVFSSNGDRYNWKWEGMIGDDCGSAITSKTEASLTSNIQNNLQNSSSYTVSEAIIAAFEEISKNINKVSIDWEILLLFIFVNISFAGCAALCFINVCIKKYENDPRISSFRCTTDKEKPTVYDCENCGGWYVDGIHDSCPYCGAKIKKN